MWLHPPSFSIVTLHFGHSFVLAAIHVDVSESSAHFFIHFFNKRHWTGSCQFSPHSKQKICPHLHTTGLDSTCITLIAYVQSADGHQRSSRLHFNGRKIEVFWVQKWEHYQAARLGAFITSTKLFVIRCWYFSFTLASGTRFITVTSSTSISQPWAAHAIDWPNPSSIIFVVKYSPQQAVQNLWPHFKPVIIYVKQKQKS